jgi:hypothetical protein
MRILRLLISATLLAVAWTPIIRAAPPTDGQVMAPPPVDVLPTWWQAPQPAPESARHPIPLLLPGGSTISGTLTTNDTWGPGVITVTGDILISPTVTIVITPGTTVQMATSDGANLGIDLNRIETIVSGALQVNGPVTFTSQSGAPKGGDWYGIRFLTGSAGWLDQASPSREPPLT